MYTLCFSAQHKSMVQTFWRVNHIRRPKVSTSISTGSAQKISTSSQKVGYTILQEYQNDIKKRFRNSDDAPAKWKEWLELQKTSSRRATLKSSVDGNPTAPSLDADESVSLLQASKASSSSASSSLTLEWSMEAFLLSSEDYQQYVCMLLSQCQMDYCTGFSITACSLSASMYYLLTSL